jgi:O-antigen/teichoic acid export membrane protein
MMSADPIVVQSHFDHAGPYIFGGALARSIVILAGSFTAVMFPKVARSLARGRKTDVVSVTLIGTLVLGLVGTVGLRVAAPVAIKVLSKAEYVSFLPLIHWYALAMVPLALANVVINDLLARGKFRFVPWIVALAAGYWLALQRFHGSFATVIAVLGGANLALLAVIVIFHQWEAARERSLFRRSDKARQTTWSAPAP